MSKATKKKTVEPAVSANVRTERPAWVRDDSVTDLLAKLKHKQREVSTSRQATTKKLGEMKVGFDGLKKTTKELLKTQNHNITTIGRKL